MQKRVLSYLHVLVKSMATSKEMDPMKRDYLGHVNGLQTPIQIKSECPLRPSEIENEWHMMKNQNSLYFAQR